jgi:hypothetical protein
MIHEMPPLSDEAVKDEGLVFFRLGRRGLFAFNSRNGAWRLKRSFAAAGGERDEERCGEEEGEGAGHGGSGVE